MFENLFGTTTAIVKPKTKMFEGIFDVAKKTQPIIEKPKFRTVSLPEHLGGGEYKTARAGTLLKTPRAYADLDTKEQQERDHIISVALGGTSSKANLQYLKTTEEGRQEGKVSVEQSVINDYLNNKISLPEARAKIAHKQQQIKGLIPKQGVKSYLWEEFKDIFIPKKEPKAEEAKTTSDFFVEELAGLVDKVIGKPIRTIMGEGEKFKMTIGGEEFEATLPVDPFAAMGVSKTVGGSARKYFTKIIKKGTPKIVKIAKQAMSKIIGETDINKIKALESTLKNLSKGKIVKLPQIKPVIKEIGEKVAEKVKISTTKLKERGFTSSVKSKFPELKKVAGQYIPRSTDDLALKAKNLIKVDLQTAEKVARTQTNENAVAITAELIKHYSDEALRATDGAVKEVLYDKAAKTANVMARKLTEQGRSIQAASILSRLTPEGQVKFAAKEILKWNEFNPKKLIPELTGEQAKNILKEMQAIQRMVDGEAKSIRFFNLQKQIKDLIPTPLTKKLISIWKAGLLTGIKTSGLNIFANIHHGITEIAKDIPAAVVDSISSLFTGKRTLAFTTKNLGKGGVEGVKKGWRYLTIGFDERNIAAKYDYQHITWGKNKVWKAIGKYSDTVFKILGSEDQPFYYAVKARSFADQASAKAINKGLKGSARKKFIQELIENPTELMQKYASLDGMTAVFQQNTLLGKLARAIQKAPAGEIVVPFGKTPSAVATQIINYSPVGIVNTIIKNIGKGKFDQRVFSQGIGRGITGTTILGIGAYLFKQDKILLDYPTNKKERELWKLEGKKPNTIKIGNKYRTIQAFGPAGNLLVVGGHIQSAFDSKGSPTEAISEVFYGSAKSFTEQTFLQGMNNMVSAITDPERNAAYVLQSTISSLIPTLSSDIARVFDPLERRRETLIDALKARVPGAKRTLEPQITVLGEERERVGNVLEVLADPTRPSEEISTPLINEFRRLWDLDYRISPTLLGDKKGYDVLTSEENTELWKRAGEITNEKLSNLIATDKYDKLFDEAKAKKIEEFVRKSKIAGSAEMIIELTKDLTEKELKIKLSELKAGKILTQNVYNKYLKLK